jgi:hypothetical protein
MPDYSKGKIYIIRAPNTEQIYIGSTTMALKARLRVHQRQGLHGGCRSASLVAAPGHTIELLEDFPCATGEDLRRREGHHIRENAGRALNKNIAGRTTAEYMAEHAEDYRRRANEWYKNNRDRRKAYEAQTREYRLAWMRNYYQTVVKPRKDALRSANASPDTSTNSTDTEGLADLPAAAILNPTSVAAESDAGV